MQPVSKVKEVVDHQLRARRALLLYKVYGNSALLLLNRTSLNSVNAHLVPSRRYANDVITHAQTKLANASFDLTSNTCTLEKNVRSQSLQ